MEKGGASGRDEVGGDGDATGTGETGILDASKTTADATRCYIPSEIFKLPDYAGGKWLVQQLSKALNVVDSMGRMVLRDDHP
jgi:hypothetical protein